MCKLDLDNLVVNNITGEKKQECLRAVMTFKMLSLTRTAINCQVGRSFAARCLWVKSETYTLLRK